MCVLHAVESAPAPGDHMNEGCPQCPVLSSPAQLCRLMPVASLMDSINHLFTLPHFLLPSIFPALKIFQKT